MKYLGLYINNKFSFKKHIEAIIKKCNIALSIFFKILKNSCKLKSSIKLIFYKIMIRSLIGHAYPSWFNISPEEMEKIRIQERKCLRYCSGINRQEDNDNFKYVKNEELYENCKIIRIDNFLAQSALKFWNSLQNLENNLTQNIVNQEVNLNDNYYSIKHISVLNENNLIYNANNQIVYFNGRFDNSQFVA